jgi:hypothetical protein
MHNDQWAMNSEHCALCIVRYALCIDLSEILFKKLLRAALTRRPSRGLHLPQLDAPDLS